jgi:hypothetical protein
MDGFRRTDRPTIPSCLTNDVEWLIPGVFVRAGRTDGTSITLAFCDVFELQSGKIRRLISYLMVIT